MMARPRFLLITYPAMGHINPTLQFAKRLAAATEADITFAIQLSAYRHMSKGSDDQTMKDIETANGSVISFAPFSVEGYDDTFGLGTQNSLQNMFLETARCGTQAITDLVVSARDDGRPYTLLVYTLLLPWAGIVADKLGVPSVMLWIQPAAVFAIYYHYFYGSGDIIRELCAKDDKSCKVSLPGMSLELARRDLPSFVDPEDTYYVTLSSCEEEFELIRSGSQRRILVNSFDELEIEALRAVPDLNLIGVGPLIPSSFLDPKEPFDNKSKDKYIDWLNSKPKATVVYVSFGTLWLPPKQQLEEIAKGLLEFERPFLWVIREKTQNDEKGDGYGELSCREELDKLGMIVPWCSQVEVLCSESVGCFVSHCGWNSTLETLASGVPVVAIPRWSDQGTSAKLVEDSWKMGVRVKLNRNEIVPSDEIKRCLELVMGENEDGVEIRRNAMKWKDLTREAAKEGGSSHKNIKALVAEMIQGAHV